MHGVVSNHSCVQTACYFSSFVSILFANISTHCDILKSQLFTCKRYFLLFFSDVKQKIGIVIGTDLKPIYPIEGAILLDNNDFTTDKTKEKILQILNEKKRDRQGVDVILSDMAPNATGVKSMDHVNIVNLVYHVIR